MMNPWGEIPLDDYENHMKLDSVMQLQAMNQMMKGQFDSYEVQSAMVLGIAGGNGLEHVDKNRFKTIYDVQILFVDFKTPPSLSESGVLKECRKFAPTSGTRYIRRSASE